MYSSYFFISKLLIVDCFCLNVIAFRISDDVQYNATDRIFTGLFRTIQSVSVHTVIRCILLFWRRTTHETNRVSNLV